MSKKNKIIHFSILFAIILLAIVLRVYNINSVPAGIYPDEANNGTNAYDAQLNNDYQWFYPDNNGREGLYINMIALFFKLSGVSMLTLKLTSIIMGVLTVVGVYLLSRELFISKPRLALIASYLTAVSFWAINFSRIAFRAIMMLPILTFSFYFIFRGLRTKRWWNFAIAGFIFGLGFHTYIAFRIAPLLLVVLFFLLLLQYGKKLFTNHWKHAIVFIIFMIISALPIFYTLYSHPEFVNSRTSDVSVFANNDGNLPLALTQTITKSLLMFNVYGDQNWRHGFPPYPTLEPFVGLMFLGGLVLSTVIFFKYIYKRFFANIKNRKFVIHGLLLAWFIGFLAPEFLTNEGLPHSLRSIGVLPIVYIFAAFCINFLIDLASRHSKFTYNLTLSLMIVLLLLAGICNTIKYHKFWAQSTEQASAFNQDLTDIAKYIHTIPKTTKIYVIADNMQRLPILLLNENRPNLLFISDSETEKIQIDSNFLIISPIQKDDLALQLSEVTDIVNQTISTSHNQEFTIIYSLNQ
jgi:4-amino-4-deoxy-L-arabinose transferase-like glycosyltransferase